MFEFAVSAACGWVAFIAILLALVYLLNWVVEDFLEYASAIAFIIIPPSAFAALAIAAKVYEAMS